MKNEQVEIKKLGINGEGIGYIHKKICFVENAIPGEIVEVEIIENNRKFLKGKVVKTIQPSAHRVKTFCKEDQNCQGCALTALAYSRQLIFKKDILKNALEKYTDFNVEELPIRSTLASPKQKGYRHVVSLPVTYFNGKIRVGIYQRNSQYLTLMDQCCMQDSLINEILVKVEDILNAHGVRDYNDKIKKGLRFMRVRNIDGHIQILFVTGTNGLSEEVTKEIAQIDHVDSLFLTINTSRYQEFELQGYKKIYGESKLPFTCFHQQYLYSIKSDFPINPEMEKNKLEIIRSMIQSEQSLISLYCGIGLLELSLDNDIVAVDDKNYHVKDAQDNAQFLRKENVKFICRDINEAVISQCKKNKFDCMIIRHDHMSDSVKQSMILSKIPNVIYVCDHPSSLARDLQDLNDYYQVETIIPLDMLPYTAKIETIVKLHRR